MVYLCNVVHLVWYLTVFKVIYQPSSLLIDYSLSQYIDIEIIKTNVQTYLKSETTTAHKHAHSTNSLLHVTCTF